MCVHIFLEYGFYKEQVCLVWCLKGKSGWNRALQKSSCVNKSTPETAGDVKLACLVCRGELTAGNLVTAQDEPSWGGGSPEEDLVSAQGEPSWQCVGQS